MILYHGTSESMLDKIFLEGLYVRDGYVYLTNRKRMAELFARQKPGRPAILKVRVTDKSLLLPDLNMYDTPTKSLTKKYGVGIDDPLWGADGIEGPLNDFDWETSLEEVNSVLYDGKIHPRDIKIFE